MSSTPTTIHVWVTKYALTKGILEFDAETTNFSHMVCLPFNPTEPFLRRQYFHDNEWHTTRAAAVARAEEMRQAKLKTIWDLRGLAMTYLGRFRAAQSL